MTDMTDLLARLQAATQGGGNEWDAYAVSPDGTEDGNWRLIGTRRTREAAKRLVERHTLAKGGVE